LSPDRDLLQAELRWDSEIMDVKMENDMVNGQNTLKLCSQCAGMQVVSKSLGEMARMWDVQSGE
jgi:hypothetical protein